MTFQRYSDARSENWDRWLWFRVIHPMDRWKRNRGSLVFLPLQTYGFHQLFFRYICISSKKKQACYHDTMWVCVKMEYPQKKCWLRTSGFLRFPIEMASFGGIPPTLGTHTFQVRLPIRLVNWGVHPTWWVICGLYVWEYVQLHIMEHILT
jgi:hypothetical protein